MTDSSLIQKSHCINYILFTSSWNCG
uniref:Uncharacterized protein n=1 Tax=Anguilla anguilla TaxID=7936 RepID=A0A0E9RK40_ANGAN